MSKHILSQEQKLTNPPDPIRSSFSIDRYSREAIRRGAERYGTTQGEVVNLAPLLYALVADISLERRSHQLQAVKTLVDQAIGSLDAIRGLAPHLSPAIRSAIAIANEICDIEQEAIRNREIHGAQKAGASGYSNFGFDPDILDLDTDEVPDPFFEILRELQHQAYPGVDVESDDENVGVSALELSDGKIEFQCCESSEDKELRKKHGDDVAKLILSGLISASEAEKRFPPLPPFLDEISNEIEGEDDS